MSGAKTSKLEVDRQYLIESSTIRNGFIVTVVLGGILLFTLLLSASWGKSGQYANPDTSQYQTTLAEATEFLNSTSPAKTVDRVLIPIEDAMTAVVNKDFNEAEIALSSSYSLINQTPANTSLGEQVTQMLLFLLSGLAEEESTPTSERVSIPIDNAIEAVANKGIDAITASLKDQSEIRAVQAKGEVSLTIQNNSRFFSPNKYVEIKVRKALVIAGDSVQKGQTLFRMRFAQDIVSPLTGTVTEVYVSEGDVVTSDQELAKIEVEDASAQ